MLHLFEWPKLRTHYLEDREEKRAQHPAEFEPTNSLLQGMRSIAVLQPLTHFSNNLLTCWFIGSSRCWWVRMSWEVAYGAIGSLSSLFLTSDITGQVWARGPEIWCRHWRQNNLATPISYCLMKAKVQQEVNKKHWQRTQMFLIMKLLWNSIFHTT